MSGVFLRFGWYSFLKKNESFAGLWFGRNFWTLTGAIIAWQELLNNKVRGLSPAIERRFSNRDWF